ncbi:MAG TPA: hypothetical protein DD473_12740 [Planctomycetaceae bacterium]|nr:hypothetical protein [Planctomycetaceae bacterium]
MKQRIFDLAEFYIRRNYRNRLSLLLDKYPYLLSSHESLIVFSTIWSNRALLPWLLERGVHPDCRMGKNCNTPLMQAASDGDIETMSILIAYGADCNARNQVNELPLGFACTWKQWAAAALLIDSGADVNGIEDDWGTHLDVMLRCECSIGIDLIRSKGGLTQRELY